MAGTLTRIFSDIHYGDRLSHVAAFGRLTPLCAGAGSIVINGDALDTRPGPDPEHTDRCRRELAEFVGGIGSPVTFVTGNHDPDISGDHSLDLAGNRVFVVHGDILFDDIVPWGRDAPEIRRRLRVALAALPEASRDRLEDRLAAYRRVAAGIPQRHQSERRALRYLPQLARDTLFPRSALAILWAWRVLPGRAAALAARHRPDARVIVVGHTHRPGVWRSPGGLAVVNTGSFTRPFGAYAVDVADGAATVRRIVRRSGDYHPGPEVASIPL